MADIFSFLQIRPHIKQGLLIFVNPLDDNFAMLCRKRTRKFFCRIDGKTGRAVVSSVIDMQMRHFMSALFVHPKFYVLGSIHHKHQNIFWMIPFIV